MGREGEGEWEEEVEEMVEREEREEVAGGRMLGDGGMRVLKMRGQGR